LYTATNSGSLADTLGMESFVLQREYRSFFFNAAVQAPSINQILDTSGSLRIRWTKYTQPAFGKYIVRKNGTVIAQLTDVNQTEYYDNAFVGSYVGYQIGLQIGGVEIGGMQTSFNGPIPLFASSTLVDDSSRIQLTWSRCRFDSGFFSYRLYRSTGSSSPSSLITEIHDIGDTTFIDEEPIFGYSMYELGVTPRTGDPPTERARVFPTSIGKSISPFPERVHFEFINATNRIYAFWYQQSPANIPMRLFDGTTFQVLRSQAYYSTSIWVHLIETGSDVSPNGQWCYLIISGDEIYPVDPTTLNLIIPSIHLSAMYPEPWTGTYSISVSDNNRLAVVGHVNNGGVRLALFDLNAMHLLGRTYSSELQANNLQISKDGVYIINGDSLYQLGIDTLLKVGSVSRTAKFLDEPNRIVQQVGTTLQVLQVPDLSIMTQFDLGSDPIFTDYDQKTGYLGCNSRSGAYYYIIDAATGTVKKRIPVYSYQYRFQNSAVFGYGRYLRFQFN
jgi:DNA-binding beta-propeller fold protein YncE